MALSTAERQAAERHLAECRDAVADFEVAAAVGGLIALTTGTLPIYAPSAVLMAALLRRHARHAERGVEDPPRQDFEVTTRPRRSLLDPSRYLKGDPLRNASVPTAETLRHATALLSAVVRATERAEGAAQWNQRQHYVARSLEALMWSRELAHLSPRFTMRSEAYAAAFELSALRTELERSSELPERAEVRREVPARPKRSMYAYFDRAVRPVARALDLETLAERLPLDIVDPHAMARRAPPELVEFASALTEYAGALVASRVRIAGT